MARFGSGGQNPGKRNESVNNNNQSEQQNDAAWTPPLWLTKGRHPPRPRSLTIPIPPVPLATRKAVQKSIARQRPAHFKQQVQMLQLQTKLQGQQDKVEKAQQKLIQLEENKSERLQEIKVIREEEREASLKTMQAGMEKECQDKLKEEEEEWKETTEREMKAAKRQFKKEQAEAEEKELESHKQKLEEEAQEKKKSQQELLQKGSIEDGEVGADGPAAEAAAEDDSKGLPSEKLEGEHKAIQEKLDNFKDKKKELVWLLKQVIKAENKRKASETFIPKKKLKL